MEYGWFCSRRDRLLRSRPPSSGAPRGARSSSGLLIGIVLPFIGLIAALLYRFEQAEPERRCPRCGRVLKLYVQVCPTCGEDLYLPDPAEVRQPEL